MTQPVLVGIDGSEESLAAADWATEEALLRQAKLCVLTVTTAGSEDTAWALVRETGYRCRQRNVDVTEDVAFGYAALELARRSADAQVVVVGSRGRRALASVVLGSVSLAVVMGSACPAVVIPRRRTSYAFGPVVVGLDFPLRSAHILRFAFDAAVARRTVLRVVHVWRKGMERHASWSSVDDAQHDVASHLVNWQQEYPGVPVHTEVRYGKPADELARAAADAQLMVIGRERGGLFGGGLGPVSQSVFHDADCPVAVVDEG